ncbi:DNA mismatch repair protein MutS [Mucilaginibacter sp. RS28]|uniref:DNA mismatch repair protein MutS n=1 Tax=Mucilaginibacter straminoryzae TaxID=2932774 RepID=A0A9X1X6A9_9SPHI|nr:DNA mismatch repair protein MutS [Mucilaginibacter straminoryzae]MCJ8211718.1 DNA mismatch repair protein MutS [Mucilaginibacter straminoryzae]
MQEKIIDQYQSNAAEASQQFNKYERQVNLYSVFRLIDFLLLLASVYYAVKWGDLLFFALSFVVLGLAFAWLVKKQSLFEQQKKYFAALKAVNMNEVDSMANRGNIYSNGSQFYDEKHFYTSDLDIFGSRSLYQLVNRAATYRGNQTLSAWLQKAADRDTIIARQDAIKELAAKNDWKLDVQALLLFNKNEQTDQLKQFLRYLQTPLNLPGEKWLTVYSKVAPLVMLGLIGLSFFYPLGSVVALVGLGNVALVGSRIKFIQQVSLSSDKMAETLNNYAAVFERIENEPWGAPLNKQLSEEVSSGHGLTTSAKIKQLYRLIDKFNYRLNMLVGFFLNAFLLWDIRQIIAIENWKRQYQHDFEKAFEVVSEFEALISLTSLHINYPEWCFPQIAVGNGYTLTAAAIAHPLIDETTRVANDYLMADTFGIDIITGSNMAGKSTFLRTLGINTVLALAGAPACAAEMEVSVISLFTYMRIKDSLNESTSTFKAELDRLQMLLNAVQGDEKIFFLVDEMLRGTNSTDKYLGSKAVIENLISHQGVGLVATHDLQLAQLEQKYPGYVRNFYFDIEVKDDEMLFDYKLKPGECKTFNALLLLKRIGIDTTALD